MHVWIAQSHHTDNRKDGGMVGYAGTQLLNHKSVYLLVQADVIGSDRHDIVPGYPGSFEHSPDVFKRLKDFCVQGSWERKVFRPAALTGGLDPIADFYGFRMVEIFVLLVPLAID